MPEFNSTELMFLEALGIIAVACVFVPLSRWLNLGTVIGYLAAGIAAGAFMSFSFSDHPEELLHFAEFGIVLFLFVIGLEFRPARLWQLRGVIFGRGLIQVLSCGVVLSIPALLFGLTWQASLIIGLGLALSSTALVMQELDEKGERSTEHGQSAISILLFEDLAIVPLLLLVQLLAPAGDTATGFTDNLLSVLGGVAAIGALILIGRYLLDPMFRVLAATRVPEIMTASALGVVIFAGLLLGVSGLSYAMGSFIAGVMLAGSLYRHEVEADIEPFRGLFLGLFFVAVGLSLDLESVAQNWLLILCAVPMFMTLKALSIYIVGRLFGAGHPPALRTALMLSQHGEFGFVLFAAASSALLFSDEIASILVCIVTLSMAVSSQSDRLIRLFLKPEPGRELPEDFDGAGGSVLIVGFGRFGQVVTQPLLAAGVPLTIIDNDAHRVEEAAVFGQRIYFGDGTRRDVLRAAGAEEARLIVIAVDDADTANRIVDLIKREFGHVRILVRAYDRLHSIQLGLRGVDGSVRETLESAYALGGQALGLLGVPEGEIVETLENARRQDIARLDEQTTMVRGATDRKTMIERVRPQPLASRRAGQEGQKAAE